VDPSFGIVAAGALRRQAGQLGVPALEISLIEAKRPRGLSPTDAHQAAASVVDVAAPVTDVKSQLSIFLYGSQHGMQIASLQKRQDHWLR
jgi:hypothetical protein